MRPDEREALPDGATEGADGTITLTLGHGAGEAPVDCLILRRLNGGDMVKLLRSPALESQAVAMAAGWTLRACLDRSSRWQPSDLDRAGEVLVLLTGVGQEFPERAVAEAGRAIRLPFNHPARDGLGIWRRELVFRPLSSARLAGIPRNTERAIPAFVHHSTGIPLPQVRGLLDHMDATDFSAVHQVINRMNLA
jgi:hypothetical protein